MLQSIVEEINFDDLPTPWSFLDVVNFSKKKKLWDFQQEGLKNAIKVLYLFFKKDQANKSNFYQRYVLNGLDEDLEENLDIKLFKIKSKIAEILKEYYPVENEKIKFKEFINRAGFWMATGSGKTLLIIKLIEVLKKLMDANEIPKKDILFLTYRDDLILQFKKHVDEFNELAMKRGFKINLVELTEYEKVKKESLIPFFDQITVFYYKSDLISDEQKEKIVDFKNYENGGNWYLLLDEAHKGDKEESKRQMFYSIMSRNGFLFNFSATFVDRRDIITTAYNFNLSRFISEGYGKHIYLLKQEMRAFREREDYNREEKQKIVLKSLILLTYIKKVAKKIRDIRGDIYHEPLLLTLVNSVNLGEENGRKPDLKIFFEEIERIAKGEVKGEIFEVAKKELLKEFLESPSLLFEETENIKLDATSIRSISLEDILKYVYNSERYGEIEAILIPGEKKEIILKLKSTEKPFALIRIGNAFGWVKDNLKGYEIHETWEDKSIFENLDEKEDISILMGSRMFYEGWDSNRPNVILFINIGVGKDAKKFVIQSVGRGVRIEPLKNKRKRLLYLYNSEEDEGLLMELGGDALVKPLETLFIFGTRRDVLEEVINTLKEEQIEENLELKINEEAKEKILLIPVYKPVGKKIYQLRDPQKIILSEENYQTIEEYFNTLDDRIILVQNNLELNLLSHIKSSFEKKDKYYKISSESISMPLQVLINKIIKHFDVDFKEIDKFKTLENEIVHFKKIKVISKTLEETKELKEKINNVLEFKDKESKKEKLKMLLRNGRLSIDEYTKEIEKISQLKKEETFKDIKIKYIVNHYYLPLLLSTKEKIDYIKHVIKTRSEVKFIEDLESFIEKNNKLDIDWWLFSKIDEHLDEVFIPYYNPENNSMVNFKPDFIFWISKDKNYFIVFVDPKGVTHTEFEYKVDGFKRLFEENDKPKTFQHGDFKIRVFLFMFTEDKNKVSEGYRKYWLDDVKSIFEVALKYNNVD